MRVGRGERLLHRGASGEAEGELRAIHAVVAAVDEGHRAVDDPEAERSLVHRLSHAFLNRRDPLFRNGAAVDLLLEDEARAAGQGLHLDNHIAELAMTSRLLLVAALLGHRLPDRFAIADRRRMALHLDS